MTSDTQIFRQIQTWLRQQERVYLLTIVSVEEHAPMPAGSLLAFNLRCEKIGSILRPEQDSLVIKQLVENTLENLQLPAVISLPSPQYALISELAEHHARLKVLVESMESVAQVQSILTALEEGKLVTRNICLETGESSLHPNRDNQRVHFDEHNVRCVYHPDELLMLIGANEISLKLANIASSLGYAVVINAPGHPRPASLQESIIWSSIPTGDAIRQNIIHPFCSVVVLETHTDQADQAVMAILDTPARYIGILGSNVMAKERNERLLENGIRAESLQRIHCPVGLPIGSHTPEEIAVSILSEMIASEHALHVSMVTSGQRRRILFASRPVAAEIVRPTVERTRCSIKDIPIENPWKDCCPVDNADELPEK